MASAAASDRIAAFLRSRSGGSAETVRTYGKRLARYVAASGGPGIDRDRYDAVHRRDPAAGAAAQRDRPRLQRPAALRAVQRDPDGGVAAPEVEGGPRRVAPRRGVRRAPARGDRLAPRRGGPRLRARPAPGHGDPAERVPQPPVEGHRPRGGAARRPGREGGQAEGDPAPGGRPGGDAARDRGGARGVLAALPEEVPRRGAGGPRVRLAGARALPHPQLAPGGGGPCEPRGAGPPAHAPAQLRHGPGAPGSAGYRCSTIVGPRELGHDVEIHEGDGGRRCRSPQESRGENIGVRACQRC